MQKQGRENNRYIIYLKSFIIGALVTAILICIFGALMYFLELDKNLSPILATVSIALGSLAAAFYNGRQFKRRGLLVGFLTGLTSFLIITLISLIVDKGGITSNTLFHFIIIMLASLIGGILGVNNKTNQKYI